jgi:heme/copper-type cytochrome/quinol oxidase subunit 3
MDCFVAAAYPQLPGPTGGRQRSVRLRRAADPARAAGIRLASSFKLREPEVIMSELVDPTHTSTGLDNRKLGMWIFLATEVMLFSALIAAFLQMKARSPADANEVLNIPITAVNTFILIISSTTVVLGLAAIQDGEKKKLLRYLVLTLLLGATFLGVQVFEYTQLLHEGLTPSGSLFGGAFYTLTGFHGLHVFIGLIWCLSLILMARKGVFSHRNYARIEIFGLYWHFVDIVWILLFTIVYLL